LSDGLERTTAGANVGKFGSANRTREDFERALSEAKKSEARLRKIIGTIPPRATLAFASRVEIPPKEESENCDRTATDLKPL
jgi:hypothetical protein